MIRSLLSFPVRAAARGFAAAVSTEPLPTLLFGPVDMPADWRPIPSPVPPGGAA